MLKIAKDETSSLFKYVLFIRTWTWHGNVSVCVERDDLRSQVFSALPDLLSEKGRQHESMDVKVVYKEGGFHISQATHQSNKLCLNMSQTV